MREMKDSGIEWIGKIPNNWRITRIKYVCNSRSEKAFFKHETDSYLGLENVVGFSDKIIETDTTYADGYYDTYKAGDVLFNKLRPYLGKVIIASTDGFCTGEFVKLFNYQGDRRYLRYWMIDEQFITEVDNSTYGAKMPRANPEFVMNMPIPVIPYIEQFAISNYLDTKCAEIDALAADIQSQIDTLEQYKRSVITEAVTKGLEKDVEMKESGSQYWGDIPVKWDIVDIKYLFEIVKRIAGHEGYDILSITQHGIKVRDTSKNEGQVAADYSNYQFLYPGEYAMNHMDLLTGWVDLSDKFGVTSPDYRVFRLRDTKRNSRRYYKYIMQICYMCKIFYSLGNGVSNLGRWRLQTSSFNNFKVPVPPYEEQEEISDYLDAKIREIEATIELKNEQLSTLDLFKKSLIYEYVTGKKEVPSV